MAKHLSAILKSYSDVISGKLPAAKITALKTGDNPGVDYAGKMPDEREFVASHSVEKHADRNGNGDDLFNAANIKTTPAGRHGHLPKPEDIKVYTQANEETKKDEGEYDYEGDMAINALKSIVRNAGKMVDILKPDTNLPEWVQSKITLAHDYMQSATDYMLSEIDEEVEQVEESKRVRPKVASDNIGKKGPYTSKAGETPSQLKKDIASNKNKVQEAKMCESCGKSPCQCDSDEEMPKEKSKGKKLLLGAKKALQEKAESVAQQKLMAMALAYKRGEMDDASPQVKKLADSMTEKQLRDYAKTKHEGLPQKVQKESAPASTPITFPVTNSREGFKL